MSLTSATGKIQTDTAPNLRDRIDRERRARPVCWPSSPPCTPHAFEKAPPGTFSSAILVESIEIATGNLRNFPITWVIPTYSLNFTKIILFQLTKTVAFPRRSNRSELALTAGSQVRKRAGCFLYLEVRHGQINHADRAFTRRGASRGSPAALLVDGSPSVDLRGAVYARNLPWMGKHAIAPPPSRRRQTVRSSASAREHRLALWRQTGCAGPPVPQSSKRRSGPVLRFLIAPRRESYSCASNRLVIDADPIASRNSGCRTKRHLRPPKGQTNAARVLVTFRSGKTINLRILVESR
jgi:hypothetical protein